MKFFAKGLLRLIQPKRLILFGLGMAVLLAALHSLLASWQDGTRQYATINNHRMAFRVAGKGRPAFVFIAGLGDGMATFQDVADEIGEDTTVILYDRPGYGGSAPASGARDALAADQDLHGLLAKTGVAGPYVLVGHSLGGLYAEYYAAQHPNEVTGIILEEARPAEFTRRCLAALGKTACSPPGWIVRLLPQATQRELAALEQTSKQVQKSRALENKPVLILSRPKGKSVFDALWNDAQAGLTARYPGAVHLSAAAGSHYLHRDQRDWFVAAARDFLLRARYIE